MKTFNIKSNDENALEAGKKLSEIIRAETKREKVIKIIHGYGSTGVGGVIKGTVRKSLQNKLNKKEIKAFIPGEAIKGFMGFTTVVDNYKHLISSDMDYNNSNDGITYVILND